MESYRHKKFDLRRPRSDESIQLEIKQELLSHNLREQEEQMEHNNNNSNSSSSSQCSSDYSVSVQSLPKRRRLNSTICDGSESASSSHSLPSAAISPEELRDICKYHGNMVRNFPKKERTPKDQERRNKNTIACRMSRRVKKLEHLTIEVQYKEFKSEHLKIVEQSERALAYFNYLKNLVKTPVPASAASPVPAPVKNFSIDYLINGIAGEQC